ncbi:hypothetical protein BHE74_00057448 [Ensete ventricosum]|nr:hypothetical protein BHE74_00057448 [Ensete ventricosum]
MLISGFLLYNLSLASTAATLHHRILSYYFSRTLPLFVPRRSVSSVVASYPLLSSRCGYIVGSLSYPPLKENQAQYQIQSTSYGYAKIGSYFKQFKPLSLDPSPTCVFLYYSCGSREQITTILGNRSCTHMLGLFSSLMKLKQEGSTIVNYLQHIKMIIDDLTLIGHSLTDEEVLVHMLNGLSTEFKELVAAFRAHDSPISFEELYDKLTDYEAYLKHDDRLPGLVPGPPITAQFNQKSKR